MSFLKVISIIAALSVALKCDANFCEKQYNCDSNSLYRQIDGSCNNLKKPWIGSANSVYQRLLPSVYDDFNNTIKTKSAIKGATLPNARSVTLSMHYPVEKEGSLNLLAVLFGQLVTHDVTGLGSVKKADGTPVNCFGADRAHPDCIKIPIPPEDTLNQAQGSFTTSRTEGIFLNSNCEKSKREQVDSLTHWLDLSVIYGSDKKTNDDIRTKTDGLLKTAILNTEFKPTLPQAPLGTCFVESKERPCFKSGEGRVNENLILTAIQTIWVREHNRIARILKKLNNDWNDETLFQETRRIVVAEYQNVVYNEWLPLIIGKKLARKYLLTSSFIQGYDSKTDGQLYNEFAAAAFRFGHGMVKSSVLKRDVSFKPFRNCSLKSITLDSTEAYSNQGLDAICRGALIDRSGLNDPHITDTLTNHLFEIAVGPNIVIRNSLPTISIQRGRDHGFPSYNKYREYCHMDAANDFSDLKNIKPEVIKRLANTYQHVDDIDLFTGGMSEDSIDGAVVGQTFACIIAQQFEKLKFGDKLFYTHEVVNEKKSSLKRISSHGLYYMVREVTFAGILSVNLQSIKIQRNAFLPHHTANNPYIKNSLLQSYSIQTNDIRYYSIINRT